MAGGGFEPTPRRKYAVGYIDQWNTNTLQTEALHYGLDTSSYIERTQKADLNGIKISTKDLDLTSKQSRAMGNSETIMLSQTAIKVSLKCS